VIPNFPPSAKPIVRVATPGATEYEDRSTGEGEGLEKLANEKDYTPPDRQ
jgi:hypothetical protein